jgi:hypothetical protein
MIAALMSEVERMASDQVPIKERATRIAALTDEIEQLAYVEEALVAAAISGNANSQAHPRSPSATSRRQLSDNATILIRTSGEAMGNA